MPELPLDALIDALHDERSSEFAALRFNQRYEPAGGRSAKVHPPTYPEGTRQREGRPTPYVFEQRFRAGDAEPVDTEPVDTVLLDSVASQANRVEQALLDAVDAGTLKLPLLTLNVRIADRPIRLTTLDMPHRCSDAYLRDSETEEGTPFDKTEIGRALRGATLRDAAIVYQTCPTALVYGTWDSHRGRPEVSFKAPRVWVSELFGLEPRQGSRVGSRLDPLGMLGGDIQQDKDAVPSDWSLVTIEGDKTKERVSKEKVAPSQKDKLSNVGHGNIPPTVSTGGVAIEGAQRAASLSLSGLRRLRFPIDGNRTPARDAAGRAALAALAILGDRLAFGEPDLSLRSGCDLVVTDDAIEILCRGGRSEAVEIGRDDALSLFHSAARAAEEQGLKFLDQSPELRPRTNLQKALEATLAPLWSPGQRG